MNEDTPILYLRTPPGFSTLETAKVGAYAWQLTKDFKTPYGTPTKGFIFNGASVPKMLWGILDPAGEAFEASCIHDYLYQTTLKSKAYADEAFRDTLLAYGVDEYKALLAYRAVRRFGKGNYTS